MLPQDRKQQEWITNTKYGNICFDLTANIFSVKTSKITQQNITCMMVTTVHKSLMCEFLSIGGNYFD